MADADDEKARERTRQTRSCQQRLDRLHQLGSRNVPSVPDDVDLEGAGDVADEGGGFKIEPSSNERRSDCEESVAGADGVDGCGCQCGDDAGSSTLDQCPMPTTGDGDVGAVDSFGKSARQILDRPILISCSEPGFRL